MTRSARNKLVIAIAALLLGAAALWAITSRGELPETEIYRGVSYRCFRPPTEPEISGLVHVVRVDLTAPGIELFITPVDPTAKARGFEYRLEYVSSMVKRNDLAAAINGQYFAADSRYFDTPGDFAVAIDTSISEHQPNHISLNSYMLWFEDDLTPHVEPNKPPSAIAIARARWAISGEMPVLISGKVNSYADRIPNKRTLAGIDPKKKFLWLVTFDRASTMRATEIVSDFGATDAISLDGGGSTTMALGAAARSVAPGTVCGGWRPVATCIGVRAQPIR